MYAEVMEHKHKYESFVFICNYCDSLRTHVIFLKLKYKINYNFTTLLAIILEDESSTKNTLIDHCEL